MKKTLFRSVPVPAYLTTALSGRVLASPGRPGGRSGVASPHARDRPQRDSPDRWQAQPLHTAIVERLRQEGLGGATVIRGIHGFGADSHLHASRGLRLSHDLPIVIEIVDAADNIDGILPLLDEMIQEGMVTVERTQILAYRRPTSDMT